MARTTGNLLPATPLVMSPGEEFLLLGVRLKNIYAIDESLNPMTLTKTIRWWTHDNVMHSYDFQNEGVTTEDVTALVMAMRMS